MIYTWALSGNERNATTNTYLNQMKPPDNCWKMENFNHQY